MDLYSHGCNCSNLFLIRWKLLQFLYFSLVVLECVFYESDYLLSVSEILDNPIVSITVYKSSK